MQEKLISQIMARDTKNVIHIRQLRISWIQLGLAEVSN